MDTKRAMELFWDSGLPWYEPAGVTRAEYFQLHIESLARRLEIFPHWVPTADDISPPWPPPPFTVLCGHDIVIIPDNWQEHTP